MFIVIMDNFDIFICYDEATGGDFASALQEYLVTRRGYRVFVAHIERHKMAGKFREDHIYPIIDSCPTFILLNTLDALDRSEIQKEIQRAFPNGNTSTKDFWIFRENINDVPFITENFKTNTGIELDNLNQDPFNTIQELTRTALRKCSNKKRFSTETIQSQLNPPPPIRTQIKTNISNVFNIGDILSKLNLDIKNKQFELALNDIDSFLSFDSLNPAALNTKGLLLNNLGKYDEAIPNFELALTLDKDNIVFLHNKAITLSNANRNNEALGITEKALGLDDENIFAIIAKAFVLSQMGDVKNSLIWFEKALEKKPKNSKLISSKAAMVNRLGDPIEAKKLLKYALNLDKKNDNAWYNLGVIYAKDGKPDDAIDCYNKSLAINKFDFNSLNNKGNELRVKGNYDDSLTCFEKCSKLNEKFYLSKYNMGLIYGLKGKYEKSIKYLNEALDLAPDNINIKINKSVSLFYLGKKTDAINLVKEILDIDSKSPIAHHAIAVLYRENNQDAKSVIHFRNAYEYSDGDENFELDYILALYQEKKYTECIPIITNILKDKPESIPALTLISASYVKTNQLDEAIEKCDMLINLDSSLSVAYYNKSCAKAKLNQIYDAVKFLKKAISLDHMHKQQAKADEDFDLIRESENFKNLMDGE